MTAPATIKATEIRTIAQAMTEAGVATWSVQVETPDGRKVTVNAGGHNREDDDQFASVEYPSK
jgi:formylmethanofuran:tetrahydromethanopterin formyltransferase